MHILSSIANSSVGLFRIHEWRNREQFHFYFSHSMQHRCRHPLNLLWLMTLEYLVNVHLIKISCHHGTNKHSIWTQQPVFELCPEPSSSTSKLLNLLSEIHSILIVSLRSISSLGILRSKFCEHLFWIFWLCSFFFF